MADIPDIEKERFRLAKMDAERPITLIIREPFDYTKWRESLFED